MQIGLIGGIGPAATDFYYKRIIASYASHNRNLELTTVHADSSTLLDNLVRNDANTQVAIYQKLTGRLKVAGAGCVVITSIAGHFCIKLFEESAPLPVIDMIDVSNKAIKKSGYERIGILGTKTVMETKFYGGVPSADVIAPKGEQLINVHDAYLAMAKSGSASHEQKDIFANAIDQLRYEEKVDAIMLGGTDLALVYSGDNSDFPIIDCAAIHCDAVVDWALNN
ncbi:MAG: aspartate/glutamate racemase family protein [Pseudomonadota bacterium]